MDNTHVQVLPELSSSEKYLYLKKVSWSYKVLNVLSIFAWFSVLYGFYLVYQHSLFLLLPFTFGLLFLVAYITFLSIINLLYKNTNFQEHLHRAGTYWDTLLYQPTIDIFLPICGEDREVLINTWNGVKSLKEKHGDSVNVFVLDDKGDIDANNLAIQFGFQYISRPNKGEMKKAGNLKYAFDKTNGEYIIILDADFRPHADFISELLPYMADQAVGIVQSPQYFDTTKELHKQSPLQYGAGNIQQYFYKIIQNARGRLGGSICVGSNAIYRRVALDTIGGTAQKEHSEDVWTGFKLLAKGWKVKYVPIILAKGICPDNQYSFFKQQGRWCAGSMSLLASKEFWTAPISFKSKLPFISGFLYYLSSPIILLLPFLNVFLLANVGTQLDYWVGIYFLPSFLISLFMLFIYVYPKVKLGTFLAHMSAIWAYSFMLFSLMLGKKESWQPSGTKGAISSSYFFATISSTMYLTVYAVLIYLCAHFDKIHFGLTSIFMLFWIFVNFFIQLLYIVFQWSDLLKGKSLVPSLKKVFIESQKKDTLIASSII